MEKIQERHYLRSYSMSEWGSPLQLVLYLVLMWGQQKQMFSNVRCEVRPPLALNRCKYLTINGLVTLIASDHFFPDHFFPFLVKVSWGQQVVHSGSTIWEKVRDYWNPRIISPVALFLPLRIPLFTRLCFLLVTPLKKLATVLIFTKYSSCLYCIYFASLS